MRKNVPMTGAYLPLSQTAIIWLLLDRFRPAGWVYGVVWTVLAIYWVIDIIVIFQQKYVDVFKWVELNFERDRHSRAGEPPVDP